MVYTFCGYAIPISDLQKYADHSEGVSEYSPQPYINGVTKAFDEYPHGLNATFQEVFRDVRVITLKSGEPALFLIRADGDPTAHPNLAHYFAENAGDQRVKAVLEQCLGLKIGPFEGYMR
jgi:hypothetical protein